MLHKRGMSQHEIKESFRRQILVEVAGYSEEDVSKLDLSSIKDEDFQKMVREKLLGSMTNNGHKQKVIPMSELKTHISQGWEYIAQLPDSEAVVKLPS
jgi:hypothetical protein